MSYYYEPDYVQWLADVIIGERTFPIEDRYGHKYYAIELIRKAFAQLQAESEADHIAIVSMEALDTTRKVTVDMARAAARYANETWHGGAPSTVDDWVECIEAALKENQAS